MCAYCLADDRKVEKLSAPLRQLTNLHLFTRRPCEVIKCILFQKWGQLLCHNLYFKLFVDGEIFKHRVTKACSRVHVHASSVEWNSILDQKTVSIYLFLLCNISKFPFNRANKARHFADKLPLKACISLQKAWSTFKKHSHWLKLAPSVRLSAFSPDNHPSSKSCALNSKR